MLNQYKSVFLGAGLKARALRSSLWSFLGFGGSQAVRLASNLVLTRLLFPEAFGLMSLILVVLIGLSMFSDAGIEPSIQHSKRGDEPDFLDTAWSMQVTRGVLLWLASGILAYPLSLFYNEPALAYMLPVAGVSLFIQGLNPTRVITAGRHLMIGRLTLIDFMSQTAGVVLMVALALIFKSVWVLVAGAIASSAMKLVFCTLLLEGHKNRFRWEASAFHELFHFGKWIYLSTVTGFFVAHGDRIILGKFISIDMLGIYNIGYLLATFPLFLGEAVLGRVLIPLYREKPPSASRENFLKLRKMRILVTGSLLTLTLLMAAFASPIVSFLYDPRYAAAGGIATLISVAIMPQIILKTYDRVALASGDSRSFCIYMVISSVAQISCFLIGVSMFGLVGALVGQFIAGLAVYPALVWLARRHQAWDPLHDAIFGLSGIALGLAAVWYNIDAIAAIG
ncbi:MAG: oligosaccharide flippase family protein [Ruegeria sp.]